MSTTMRSPPSSGLFLSSPHQYLGNCPEDEVEALTSSALDVTVLNINLAAIIGQHKQAFLEVFGRQVQLIKSRSQAFEDAHITVYDKVLLALTRHGNNLETPAAITWYCTEYLGINIAAGIEQNLKLIQDAVTVPNAFAKGLRHPFPESLQRAKHVQALTPSLSRKKSEATVLTGPQAAGGEQLGAATSKTDPTFAHLWSVYNKAHDEYLAVAEKRDMVTLEAAKFLRDTAENGIHYLKTKHPKDLTPLSEMTKTYDTTKLVVLALNGGRKRKFDAHDRDSRGRIKRHTYPAHTPEHDRQNSENRKKERPVLKPRDSRSKPPRGRGHSSVPFGYTRPVDSYYPI